MKAQQVTKCHMYSMIKASNFLCFSNVLVNKIMCYKLTSPHKEFFGLPQQKFWTVIYS
jgi:hypothetical protein